MNPLSRKNVRWALGSVIERILLPSRGESGVKN
jgi:hypothetical protein